MEGEDPFNTVEDIVVRGWRKGLLYVSCGLNVGIRKKWLTGWLHLFYLLHGYSVLLPLSRAMTFPPKMQGNVRQKWLRTLYGGDLTQDDDFGIPKITRPSEGITQELISWQSVRLKRQQWLNSPQVTCSRLSEWALSTSKEETKEGKKISFGPGSNQRHQDKQPITVLRSSNWATEGWYR